jgi:hypothetical protein
MAFPTRLTMAQLNDQFIQLDGLADGITGAAISAAVMTVTLQDFNGNNVANMTGISMTPVSPAGSYRGAVTNAFNPPAGTEYTAVFDGTNSGFKLRISLPVTVQKRTA